MSAEELKKHFAKQGVVTDAKALGSRRIGYVGYETIEEAAKAVKYFNKSYLRMSKLLVEFAQPVSSFFEFLASVLTGLISGGSKGLTNQSLQHPAESFP